MQTGRDDAGRALRVADVVGIGSPSPEWLESFKRNSRAHVRPGVPARPPRSIEITPTPDHIAMAIMTMTKMRMITTAAPTIIMFGPVGGPPP